MHAHTNKYKSKGVKMFFIGSYKQVFFPQDNNTMPKKLSETQDIGYITLLFNLLLI